MVDVAATITDMFAGMQGITPCNCALAQPAIFFCPNDKPCVAGQHYYCIPCGQKHSHAMIMITAATSEVRSKFHDLYNLVHDLTAEGKTRYEKYQRLI